jgi:long-chain acyl-CoA synthetase
VLLNHPSVDEAAVIGAPDESRGEVPMAWVTLKDGAEISELELRSHAKGSLAGYKIPRQVRIVEDFPRGPTGKILKRKLRDWLDSAPGRN